MKRGSGRPAWVFPTSLIVFQLKKPWNILSSGPSHFCLFTCYLTDSLLESSLSVVSHFDGLLSSGRDVFLFVRPWAQLKSVFFNNTTWNLTVYCFSSKYHQKIKAFFHSLIKIEFLFFRTRVQSLHSVFLCLWHLAAWLIDNSIT